jgi:hypothetical protein
MRFSNAKIFLQLMMFFLEKKVLLEKKSLFNSVSISYTLMFLDSKNLNWETFEWRKKRFIQRRTEMLKRLAEDERDFWLETTLEKLEQFNKLKIKQWYK